jgi:hydrocephalus-inducing protein
VQFARRVKVLSPESPYFKVTANGPASKVATGMEAKFTILFTPDSEADFSWDLIVCTEREKFIVPIRARGARGLLDFPAVLDFGAACPCKVTTKKSFLVRNKGRQETHFELAAVSPFAVAPRSGFLAVGESLQISVNFTPERAGFVEGELRVPFATGDVTTVQMIGAGVDIDVSVFPQSVQFLKAFVTKMSQKTFQIVNNTMTPVRFALKRFATGEEECAAARAEASALTLCRSAASDVLLKNGAFTGMDDRDDEGWGEEAAALQRQFKRTLIQAMAQKYLFESSTMKAFPLEGIVYPNSHVEVRSHILAFICRQKHPVPTSTYVSPEIPSMPLACAGDDAVLP